MIAVDTNILVYAHREDSPWHREANQHITALAQGAAPWAIPWPCLHEFLAIVTHPRRYAPPTPMKLALEQVDAWMESPGLILLAESSGHWDVLKLAATSGKAVGPMIHDARIAALCTVHGIDELWTADRDFSRFGALRTRNPLLQSPR